MTQSGGRVWRSQWVATRLGVALEPDGSAPGCRVTDLIELALRRNPRRAHLAVSKVLGKHIPADPVLVAAAGWFLGNLVGDRILGRGAECASEESRLLERATEGSREAALQLLVLNQERAAARSAAERKALSECLVIGYAETATALGHLVAEALRAPYAHSTRRALPAVVPWATFREAHSHATAHRLLALDPSRLEPRSTVVLVDDELSTGKTIANTIDAIEAISPRERYVVGSLVDLRSPSARAELTCFANQRGLQLDVAALATGYLRLSADAVDRARLLMQEFSGRRIDSGELAGTAARRRSEPRDHGPAGWPKAVRATGRLGYGAADRQSAQRAAEVVADRLRLHLVGDRVLVLGTEELMYAPLLIAQHLAAKAAPDTVVRFSSTTRSPIWVTDAEGYPVRSVVTYADQEHPLDESANRFAYNLFVPESADHTFTDIVLVTDGDADLPGAQLSDLVVHLSGLCEQAHVITLPSHPLPTTPLARPLRGPEFGSYARDDVTWLLKDLSDLNLERPTEDREAAVQSGRAHYAESLPIEYQPPPEYRRLFAEALEDSAAWMAEAVAVATELVLEARGKNVALASLARSGTPVGVLMRRWALFAHGLELPHYTLSIVRGRGIDLNALRYLAAHHRPPEVMFVDGWTGKGAIARELAAAIDGANRTLELPPGQRFSDEIAVLADTGHCVTIFATRDDRLIPSACLNSTVSGLVSRTVLNDRYITEADFHGAKYYKALASVDVSEAYLAAICARFASAADRLPALMAAARDRDTAVTWSGWAAVEALRDEYGIADINLIKPGVGETTRVLLRRVPWKVLIRPEAEGLTHVLRLADERGCGVEEVADLPFSCVGIIRPHLAVT